MCNCTLSKIPKEEIKRFKSAYEQVMDYINGSGAGTLTERNNNLEVHIKGKLDDPIDYFIGTYHDVKDPYFEEYLENALNEGQRLQGTEPRCALDYATDLLKSFLRKYV